MIFSGLSLNLILQCGFGLRGIAIVRQDGRQLLIKLGLLFVTVLLLWLLFSLVISRLGLGLYEYIIIFPVSALAFFCLDYCLFKLVLKKEDTCNSPVCFYDGLAGAAFFITRNIAENFAGAAALSLGFSAGILLSFVIIGEIRRRAVMENVPAFLRGSPLALVAMGLLSLVFTSAAVMLFRALEG
jgi:electron transport complex protein RnfA